MERSQKPENVTPKQKGDLGAWVAEHTIDPKVIQRELDAVAPHEDYVVNGGLQHDIGRTSKRSKKR